MKNRLLGFAVFALALLQTFFADAQRPFATLEHEGMVTAYYGVNAMVEAIAAAAQGQLLSTGYRRRSKPQVHHPQGDIGA